MRPKLTASQGGLRSAAWRAPLWASLAALALAGCAQPTHVASTSHGKEYFPSSVYGKASPKMVADGEPVPRGGGQYLVGNPYHVAGRTYVPNENPNYAAVGMASWYGDAFHGRRTANGEVYDKASLSAAHPTMPLPSYARVTNLENGYSVIVRVNDRGPFHGGRVMDVSSRVADVLDFKGTGTAKIKVEYVGRAPMEGSDDGQLLASLRTDGGPAELDGYTAPPSTMLADAGEVANRATTTVTSLFGSRSQAKAQPAPTETAAADDSSDESDSPPPRASRSRLAKAPPAPPERPFDLSAASKASTLVAVRSAPKPKPPVRLASVDRALVFAPPARPKELGASPMKHKVARANDDDE